MTLLLDGESYDALTDEVLYKRIIEACVRSREWFVRNVLGVKYIEDWQLDVLTALDNGETRISVRSGHGVGKTALCSWAIIHMLITRNNVKIPVTAPASKQMEDGLIPECHKWIGRLPDFLRSMLVITDMRIERADDKANNFVSFRTARADAPEALAGIHSDHVLAVVDEASGVPDIIYENAQGTMSTPGAIFILIGNPTRPKGYFYKTQTALKGKWWSKRVSCFDSSRVDSAFVNDIIDTWGENSPQYRVRVLGEFPLDDLDSVIPGHLLQSSIDRDIEVPHDAKRVWGLDPGRGGDPTGFVIRTDYGVEDIQQWGDGDTTVIVGRVYELYNSTPASMRPIAIYTDSIGIGGPVADRLRELGLPAIDVAVSESAAMKDRYPRLRAELWYEARRLFESRRFSLPSKLKFTAQLIDELSEPRAIYTDRGKDDVESKRAMKARGVSSPNLADALVTSLAFKGATLNGRSADVSWSAALPYTAPNIW